MAVCSRGELFGEPCRKSCCPRQLTPLLGAQVELEVVHLVPGASALTVGAKRHPHRTKEQSRNWNLSGQYMCKGLLLSSHPLPCLSSRSHFPFLSCLRRAFTIPSKLLLFPSPAHLLSSLLCELVRQQSATRADVFGAMGCAVWGPVCDRFDPPLPEIRAHKQACWPEGKHTAVWKEIQKLPESLLRGDYTLKGAWLRGEI